MSFQRFGLRISGFEPELAAFGDTPVVGVAERQLSGPDRSDYVLVRLTEVKGLAPTSPSWLVVCSRHDGQLLNAFCQEIRIGVSLLKRDDGLSIESFAAADVDYLAIGSANGQPI